MLTGARLRIVAAVVVVAGLGAGLSAGCASLLASRAASPAAQQSGAKISPSLAAVVAKPRTNGLLAISGNGAVYSVKSDGSRLRRLPVPGRLAPEAVAWSPDGTQLAFATLVLGVGTNVFTIRADGTRLRQLPRADLGVSAIAWSPDGRWIAFTGWVNFERAAFIVRADGTGLQRILTRYTVASLAWGPTGRLAISTAGTQDPDGWHGPFELWTVNADGTNPRLVSIVRQFPPAMGSPLVVDGWSASGRSLLVQGIPRYGDLSIISATGGPAHVILDCPLRSCVIVPGVGMGAQPTYQTYLTDVTLSPDGRTIAFIDGAERNTRIYTVPASGGRPQRLRIPGGPAGLAGLSWQPR